MPRVAIVTTSFPRAEGDADGHFVATEAFALARTHEVVVVAPGPLAHGAGPVRVVAVDGGDAFGAPGLAARLRSDPRRAFAAARFFGALRARVHALEADELVVHWPFPTALALGDATVHHRTTLVSHGACVRALLAMPAALRVACTDRLLRGTTRWRFVSEALRASLADALPVRLRTPLAERSFVEAAALELPARAELGPPWPRPAYVVVGRLVASKRVHAALAYAARTESIRTHEIVVVGDGPDRSTLEAAARELGLTVTFTGALSRKDALGILANSTGLLFASKLEGLSSVCREAAHYGVPVVPVP